MLKSLLRGKPKAKRGEKRAVRRELLAVEGHDVAVSVRLNPRARRIVMRVHPQPAKSPSPRPAAAAPQPRWPLRGGETQWIARQLRRLPEPVALEPGAMVPYLGADHPIRHSEARGPAPVWVADGEIRVNGRIEHAQRRLADFFKREAQDSVCGAGGGIGCAAGLPAHPHHACATPTAAGAPAARPARCPFAGG